MMTSRLLARGLITGLLAGLIAFAFAYWSGEPHINAAIEVEASHVHGMSAQGHGHAHEEGPVSREIQSTLGLFTGIAVYSTALGGLFSLAYAFSLGRLGCLQGRSLSIVIAACAFVSMALVPWLKYPANPPAVGNPETIGLRTMLFFGMLVISVVAMIAAFIFCRLFGEKHDCWSSVMMGTVLYGVIIALAGALLPTVDEVPKMFPADLLFNFRLTSIGINAIVWVCLGLGFGYWVEYRENERERISVIHQQRM